MPRRIRVCQDVYEYAKTYRSMPRRIGVCQDVYEYAGMYQTVCRYIILYIFSARALLSWDYKSSILLQE